MSEEATGILPAGQVQVVFYGGPNIFGPLTDGRFHLLH